MMHLEAYNYPSRVSQDKVDIVAKLCGIVSPYRVIVPEPNDKACYLKPGATRIYKETFYAGFRLSPPLFIFSLCVETRVCPTQLVPNAWRFIYYFLVQCSRHNIEPSVSVFRYLFKFSITSNKMGWVRIQHRNLNHSCFKSGSSTDSIPHRKEQWFYVYMEGEDWDNFFRTSFLDIYPLAGQLMDHVYAF